MEQWLPVENIPAYEVSNLGNVRSLKSGEPKNLSLKTNKHTGYLMVGFWHDGKNQTFTVHSLVAKAFLGNPPGKIGVRTGNFQVNHIDSNRQNNVVDNLEWLKKIDNTRHAARKGQYSKVLAHEQVAEIKYLLQAGQSPLHLATIYGVDNKVIYQIKNGESYSYVKPASFAECPPQKRAYRKRLDPEFVEQIKDYCQQEKSDSVIARRFNIGRSTVYNIRMGISHPT